MKERKKQTKDDLLTFINSNNNKNPIKIEIWS